MDKQHLADAADRLLADDTLLHALDAMRRDALEELTRVPADDAAQIMKWQARVAAIDEFQSELRTFIENAQPAPETTGFA